jgi:H+/Cl- antiporter ClcA
MDYAWLIPFLSLFTLLAVAVFALVSKARIEARRHDPNAPKSTLAKDGPQNGLTSLNPGSPRPEDKPNVRPVLE